jgi:hypothetical protein
MRSLLCLCLLLLVVSTRPVAATEDTAICYESAVRGTIARVDNFTSLADLGYGNADDVVLGGRFDLAVRVDRVVNGQPIRDRRITIQTIMTSQPTNRTRLVFYIRRAPSGYEALDWHFADDEIHSRFPLCASQ